VALKKIGGRLPDIGKRDFGGGGGVEKVRREIADGDRDKKIPGPNRTTSCDRGIKRAPGGRGMKSSGRGATYITKEPSRWREKKKTFPVTEKTNFRTGEFLSLQWLGEAGEKKRGGILFWPLRNIEPRGGGNEGLLGG